MKRFLSKFSRLGLVFVGMHALLVLLIPVWIKLFPPSCNIICIFSSEQSYFFLFNMPGWLITFGTFIVNILQEIKPEKVRLSGQITVIDNAVMFAFSSIVYFLIGALIQSMWVKLKNNLRRKR